MAGISAKYVGVFAAIVAIWAFAPSLLHAQGQSCGPNATETGRSESNGQITLNCQCNAGYVRSGALCVPRTVARPLTCKGALIAYNGRCQHKAAIEDRLQLRILEIFRGIQSTKASIEAERHTHIYVKLQDNLAMIEASIGMALLKRNPAELAPAALTVSAELGRMLREWGACTSTPDLQVACNNLHAFKRRLYETANELSELKQR